MRELLAVAIIIILLIPVGAGEKVHEKNVIFVVNATLYPQIKNTLNEFANSVKGYHIEIKVWSSKEPQALRNYLQEQHPAGAVLVGNITIPEYYNPLTKEYSHTLYYYMDLSGNWELKNETATPEKLTAASIWVGVVRSTDMGGNNATQINQYFEKATLYEQGKISALAEAAGFLDDDFATLYINITDNLEKLYPAKMYYHADESTIANFKYLLTEHYALAHIIVHSSGNKFYIKDGKFWDYIDEKQLDSLHPNILFYTDISCYGADFTKGAITNHLVMRGAGLGALASLGKAYPQPMSEYYASLASGSSFGAALLRYINSSLSEKDGFYRYVANLCFLGVPFLHVYTPSGYRDISKIEINGNEALKEFAAEMHLPGTGTASNPIRITGFYIHHRGHLEISNTTLLLRVEHNYLSITSTYENTGIVLKNCKNVVVENNTVLGTGVYILNSENVVVKRNLVRLSFNSGISAVRTGCRLIDNVVVDSGNGIVVGAYLAPGEYESGIIIMGNRIIRSQTGLLISGVRDSIISGNYIDAMHVGSYSLFSFSTTGIWLYNSIENRITMNTVKNVSVLIEISYAWSNRIYENNFYGKFNGSGVGFWLSAPEKNRNIWNSSAEGNYWQQWANRNNTNDRNQDGIVDYPYIIAPGNVDYRPLKYPVGAAQYPLNMPFIISTVIVVIALLAALGSVKKR
ncbi:MAG: hypothetical protein GXO25_01460 [Euryarchaeota archaeon]|nr:hypothetical protein [Euryarchaeota archaeon]